MAYSATLEYVDVGQLVLVLLLELWDMCSWSNGSNLRQLQRGRQLQCKGQPVFNFFENLILPPTFILLSFTTYLRAKSTEIHNLLYLPKELGISHQFLIYFQARCKSAEIKMGKYVQVCTHIYRNYCSQLSHKLNAVHEIFFRMIQKLTSIVCIYFFSET